MILLYLGNNDPHRHAFEQLFHTLGQSVRIIEDTQTLATVKELFEQKDAQQKPYPLPHPIMVMKDIDDETFTTIMEAIRSHGLSMQRKAMWTEHNQHWTLARLADEIEEEHRYFDDLNQLYSFFQESNQKKQDDYTAESWKQYTGVLIALYLEVNKEQPSADRLKEMLRQAQQAQDTLQTK